MGKIEEERMNLYDNTDYMEDVRRTAQLDLPWDRLKDKAVLISPDLGRDGTGRQFSDRRIDGKK